MQLLGSKILSRYSTHVTTYTDYYLVKFHLYYVIAWVAVKLGIMSVALEMGQISRGQAKPSEITHF